MVGHHTESNVNKPIRNNLEVVARRQGARECCVSTAEGISYKTKVTRRSIGKISHRQEEGLDVQY